MFGYEDIQLSFAFSGGLLLLCLLLIFLYSIYVYRYTIPQVNKSRKIFLVLLRGLALLTLCLILFEPILNLSRKLTIEPENLVFIDNSRSINIDDGTNRSESVGKILDDLVTASSAENLILHEFGNEVKEIEQDSISKIDFTDGATNLQNVFNYINNSERNVSSITLISDGVLTSGSNPYYDAINLGVQVFTIGIGDTTRRKDIELKKVLYNELVYAETPTSIIATIQNKGFTGEKITATLFEADKYISSRKINLSNTGIQNITFDYTAKSSGEKKLSIRLSELDGEFTNKNNSQLFYVNVLSNKIRVLLLASSPSSDFTFIKNSLERDENITINSIIQLSNDRFREKLDFTLVDSADVLFLIGFPSDATPEVLLNHVISKIKNDDTPYFLTLSSGISLNRLRSFTDELPFIIGQNFSGFREVQPFIQPNDAENPIFKGGNENVSESWNNLPPVLQPNVIFNPRVESRTLIQIKVNNNVINSPLIILNNFSGKRCIAVLAKDFWKWKLQVAQKRIDLFDSFVINSLRWLRSNEEQKPVEVKSIKKVYSQGERIEFKGEVFDESFNPVSGADIKIKISSGNNIYTTDMQNVGPGLYEGSIIITQTGDFSYTAEAFANGRNLGSDKGSFNIGEIDLEMVNPVMDYALLNLLANDTGGEFYFPDNYHSLIKRLEELKNISAREKILTSEIPLWSDTWMLVIAILLFSIEWFVRKRSGML